MIKLGSEELISLNEARKLFPVGRHGKRPTLCTIYRWTNEGSRGVTLEFVQLPDRRATTREAIFRFIAELTRLANEECRRTKPTAAQHSRRRREIEQAEAEADRLLGTK